MRRINAGYFLKEGVQNIFLHGFMSFAAVGIIAACLLITGSFSLLALNIDMLVTDIQSQSEISVFIDETFSPERSARIKEEIMNISGVKSAEFISKEAALKEYREGLGDDGDILMGLEKDNPLRDGYRIRMEDISMHRGINNALKEIDGIARIESRVDISEKLISIRGILNGVSVALVAMLGGVSVFIISNTVKLAMFTRREEISIMKMVGATNSFVRWPFIIEGLLLALIGALLAYLMLWGFYTYVQTVLLDGIAMVSLFPFADISENLLMILLGIGFVIGVGGSFVTISKFLKV